MLARTEEDYEKGYLVSGLKFDPRACRVWGSAKHSTTFFRFLTHVFLELTGYLLNCFSDSPYLGLRRFTRTIFRTHLDISHLIHITLEKWQEDGEGDLSCYFTTLKKKEDTGIWNITHCIKFCGGLVLEVAMDLSLDKPHN